MGSWVIQETLRDGIWFVTLTTPLLTLSFHFLSRYNTDIMLWPLAWVRTPLWSPQGPGRDCRRIPGRRCRPLSIPSQSRHSKKTPYPPTSWRRTRDCGRTQRSSPSSWDTRANLRRFSSSVVMDVRPCSSYYYPTPSPGMRNCANDKLMHSNVWSCDRRNKPQTHQRILHR